MAFTLSLGMIVSSSVFLLSLTFCCLHSIHCTCSVPCDDHQSTYFLYLPLNTYLWFSWSHPVHWPLSLPARLAHLNIDTYLSWVVTLVMRFGSRDYSHCSSAHSPSVPLSILFHICLLKCPYRDMIQRRFTPMSSALPTDIFIHILTLKCPFSELSQQSLTL